MFGASYASPSWHVHTVLRIIVRYFVDTDQLSYVDGITLVAHPEHIAELISSVFQNYTRQLDIVVVVVVVKTVVECRYDGDDSGSDRADDGYC